MVHGPCCGLQPLCYPPQIEVQHQRSLADGHLCPVRAVLHAAPGELPVDRGASTVQCLLGAYAATGLHICLESIPGQVRTPRRSHKARGPCRAACQHMSGAKSTPAMDCPCLLRHWWRQQTSSCPQTVFAIVSFGAIVLTVNVVLLGGNIGFFQVHWIFYCVSWMPTTCHWPQTRARRMQMLTMRSMACTAGHRRVLDCPCDVHSRCVYWATACSPSTWQPSSRCSFTTISSGASSFCAGGLLPCQWQTNRLVAFMQTTCTLIMLAHVPADPPARTLLSASASMYGPWSPRCTWSHLEPPVCRWIVTIGAIVWASWASVPFIGGSVAPERRALAVYPLLLLYTSVAWFALIK